jgi:hypothetical protein
MEATQTINYNNLRQIDVSAQIEKKQNLSYLSWAWAVDLLLQQDHAATWEYKEPQRWGDTVMVFCTVHAFGVSRTAQLPVMNHRNQAVPNPDAFQVNTAMQRCLAKAIALHGIGLYIYAGEDLPPDAEAAPANPLDAIAPKAQPAPPPEVPKQAEQRIDKEDATGGSGQGSGEVWPLMVPGKDDPTSTHPDHEAWSLAYEDMADRVSRSGKTPARERMTKLRELKEANQRQLDKMDPIHRIQLSASYQKRLKALGAASVEVAA